MQHAGPDLLYAVTRDYDSKSSMANIKHKNKPHSYLASIADPLHVNRPELKLLIHIYTEVKPNYKLISDVSSMDRIKKQMCNILWSGNIGINKSDNKYIQFL